MNTSEIKIIKLKGNPRTRGEILGKQLKRLIKKHLNIIKLLIFEYYQTNPIEIINDFFKNTKILESAIKLTPHLIEEVEGVAEGSGNDFKEIFATQCIDELIWYKFEKNTRFSNQCSALGILKDKDFPSIIAQNVDHINIFRDYGLILHIFDHKTSLESFIYSLSGLIALTGINNRAIAVCTNGLSLELNYSIEGLPVSFIVREILAQETYNDAIEVIQNIKQASGQNYLIGSLDNIISFECSGNSIVQYPRDKRVNRIYHTNHALVNKDLLNSSLNIAHVMEENKSLERFNFLEKHLNDSSVIITFKKLRDILSSHEGFICRHPDETPEGSSTIASVIYLLSKSPEMYVSEGMPCSNEYKKFTFL
ncbi:MAG: hypothetical protein EU535_04630 [Promethearchaeota archaeon]|nr:MAG: hypothetical protein EU535_04630 [Candidatus Lokiarchaeota archaeon]